MLEYSWEFKSLDELGSISRGKSKHRPRDASHLFGGPYPFIQTGDVKSAGLILDSYSETYSEEGLSQSKLWPKGTLCITIAANIAETSILGIDACFPDSVIGFIPHENECDVRYVKYVLELKKMEIQAAFAGSVQLNMSMKELLKWKFPIPPYDIQKKIGEYVSNYDYSMRSNQKSSITNQNIINVLFRSWFIDFDPVKAKAEGKLPYGMDEETAALFPNSFEDSELGSIPTGWTVGMMEDVLSRKQDSTTPGEHLSERHYVPIDNIDSKNLTLKNWLSYKEAASSLILFSKNDLLFGAMRPYFHKVTLAPFNGITRSTCFVFTPKIPDTLGFSLCLLNLDSTIRYSTDSSLGSTMPYAIWKNGLARHKIVLPPPKIMIAFSDAIAPLIEKIRDGGLMIRKVSYTRDVLLPRLMSGELQVS